MKCFICDATLGDTEVKWNSDADEFEPCSTCLFEISEVFAGDFPDDAVVKKEECEVDDPLDEAILAELKELS